MLRQTGTITLVDLVNTWTSSLILRKDHSYKCEKEMNTKHVNT